MRYGQEICRSRNLLADVGWKYHSEPLVLVSYETKRTMKHAEARALMQKRMYEQSKQSTKKVTKHPFRLKETDIESCQHGQASTRRACGARLIAQLGAASDKSPERSIPLC